MRSTLQLRPAHVAPPNPNENLNAFVAVDPVTGQQTFDSASWVNVVSTTANWTTANWTTASWTDGELDDGELDDGELDDGELDDGELDDGELDDGELDNRELAGVATPRPRQVPRSRDPIAVTSPDYPTG